MGIEEKIDLEPKGEIEAVKIQEIPIPRNEEELIRYFRNLRDTREFGVQLVMCSINNNFNPQRIYELCTPQERQKIGYFCDLILSLQEYKVLRQETTRDLKKLSNSLQDSYQNWVHLGDGSELARRLAELDKRTRLNYKWKVYHGTYAEDIFDWLDLYHDEYFQSKEAKKNVNNFHRGRGMVRLKL